MDAAEVVAALVEFLEIAIHELLFSRAIYPREIFELTRTPYGILSHRAAFGELQRYISTMIGSLRDEIAARRVGGLEVSLFSSGESSSHPDELVIFRLDGEHGGLPWDDDGDETAVAPIERLRRELKDALVALSAAAPVAGMRGEPSPRDGERSPTFALAITATGIDGGAMWRRGAASAAPAGALGLAPLVTADAGPLGALNVAIVARTGR